MADLVLTPERRVQLAALLDDEQRLRADYPKVVEYLDMAPRLPGTGDERTDAAFDLRFVHYMTSGRSASANPYWEIIAPSVSEIDGRRVVNGGTGQGSARLAFAQMILQAVYAYAIPSPETIDWMTTFCEGCPLVELGAGRGYWASQLSRAGLLVDAYDVEPPDKTDNVSFPRAGRQEDVWHEVSRLDEFHAGDPPNSVLFLCWPPGWGSTMASDALATFQRSGGEKLVYIGEPKGGKTGDEAFFDALSTHWELQATDKRFVSWWNLHDTAQGWVRR